MIDHLVYATPDLAATVAELEARLGVPLPPGGPHVGRGTANHLADLGGGSYLEVIGPDPDQPAPGAPRSFGIDDLREPRLVTWCARPSRSLDEVVAAAAAVGHDLGAVLDMSRRRPDGVLLEWRLSVRLHDPDHGTVPFVIDWRDSPHPTTSLAPGLRLRRLTLHHPQPDRLEDALRAVEGLGPAELVVAEGPHRVSAAVVSPRGTVTL